MSSRKQKGGNKFFNVFVGPPWSSTINNLPDINSNPNNKLTISNYYKFPFSIIDPPDSISNISGGWTISGGGKKRTKTKCKRCTKTKSKKCTKNKCKRCTKNKCKRCTKY